MGRLIMKPFNLKEYLANPSRKVVTWDGKKVKRILCTDAAGSYPIVALVENNIGSRAADSAFQYTVDGRYILGETDSKDLFFAPEKYERWINLYKDDDIVYASMDTFKTKKEAEVASCSTCIATVKIEWEE